MLAAVLALLAGTLAAGPAQAASGGGCRYANANDLGSGSSWAMWVCIASAGNQVAPDYYVDSSPNCSYAEVDLFERGGRNLPWRRVYQYADWCDARHHYAPTAPIRGNEYFLAVTMVELLGSDPDYQWHTLLYGESPHWYA